MSKRKNPAFKLPNSTSQKRIHESTLRSRAASADVVAKMPSGCCSGENTACASNGVLCFTTSGVSSFATPVSLQEARQDLTQGAKHKTKFTRKTSAILPNPSKFEPAAFVSQTITVVNDAEASCGHVRQQQESQADARMIATKPTRQSETNGFTHTISPPHVQPMSNAIAQLQTRRCSEADKRCVCGHRNGVLRFNSDRASSSATDWMRDGIQRNAENEDREQHHARRFNHRRSHPASTAATFAAVFPIGRPHR